MSGVVSMLASRRGPKFRDFHRQATCRFLTFDASIWSSGEYLVLWRSPAYCRHSTFGAPVWAGAEISDAMVRKMAEVFNRIPCREILSSGFMPKCMGAPRLDPAQGMEV